MLRIVHLITPLRTDRYGESISVAKVDKFLASAIGDIERLPDISDVQKASIVKIIDQHKILNLQ